MECEVFRSDYAWDSLFALASRFNPKRGFIFVSKVLGKHWPVEPRVMARTHAELAERLTGLRLEKPVVLIAMAETAVGLGRGVFDSYADSVGPDGLLFLQTTRYNVGLQPLLTSDEPHCHAREHAVFMDMKNPEKTRILRDAKSLVLVDDELTTGRTLRGLAGEFGKFGAVGRVACAALASFLTPAARAGLGRGLAARVSLVSLLEGTFTFRKTADMPDPAFRSSGSWAPMAGIVARERGRLGLLPGEDLPDLAGAVAGLALEPGEPVRVIGTGEFLHEPFLLARELERGGREVVFQSTTRTPVAVGAGIGSAWRFRDNYGEGLDNFLYNAPASFPGRTVVCRETAFSPDGFDVAGSLGASEILL
jgi:hypothetical protein